MDSEKAPLPQSGYVSVWKEKAAHRRTRFAQQIF